MDSSETNRPAKSNLVVWVVLAVCLLPVVASTVLYLLWQPSSFVNHGELIEPIPMANLSFNRVEGAPFTFRQFEGRWVFVTIDAAECNEVCDRKLYLMRQIRLTQGKDADRIERVWLIPDGKSPAASLMAKYEGTQIVRLADTALLSEFPAETDRGEYVYLVDHLGNLMMRYTREIDPSLMKKDITKLLRISSGWRRIEK